VINCGEQKPLAPRYNRRRAGAPGPGNTPANTMQTTQIVARENYNV
jgi:hypothetical protein